MFYIIGTEDVFVRHSSASQRQILTSEKDNQWHKWLDNHWDSQVDKSQAEEQAKKLFH